MIIPWLGGGGGGGGDVVFTTYLISASAEHVVYTCYLHISVAAIMWLGYRFDLICKMFMPVDKHGELLI